MSLAIVGGSTIDLIFTSVERLPQWPKHTEFTPDNLVLLSEPPITTIGGNGANAALIAARSGAKVVLYTSIGEDPFGNLVRGWLEESGCRVISEKRSSTPINITAANRKHGRATFFYSPVAPEIPSVRALANCSHLLVCGWPHPERLAERLPELRRRGKYVALDAGPILEGSWDVEVFTGILQGVDLLLLNEHELKTLLKARTTRSAIRHLRGAFAGDVVLKRGADGVVWYAAGAEQPVTVPAPVVRVANTVGAGDSFNGALLAGLTKGIEFGRAVRMACRAASSVVKSGRGVLGFKA